MAIERYPYGGEQIAHLRSQGKRPADMILLSLVGPLAGENNPVVIAQPGRAYRWDFLAGLEVLLLAKSADFRECVSPLLATIKALSPRYLGFWLIDRSNGRNLVVDGVEARQNGLLRHMSPADRRSFDAIHPREVQLCA